MALRNGRPKKSITRDIIFKFRMTKEEQQLLQTVSEQTGNTEESVPKKDVKIKTVTVETYGMDYGFPKTMEPFNYMNWLYSQYGISQ